jgi:drug/metabolite transporter (DMT)-like permease
MDRTGVLAAAAAAVLYGSAYVAIAVALDGFTPVGVAVYRGVLGALALGVILVAWPGLGPRMPTWAALVRLSVIGTVGGGIFVLAMIGAVALAGATVTAFVAGLYAVAAAVLALPLLGERLRPRTGVALGAALFGTLLLSGLQAGTDSIAGVVLALIAAASFGLFLVLSRRWAGGYRLSGPIVGLASASISAMVAISVAAGTSDPIALPQPPVTAVLAVVWIALGPGASAAVLSVVAMRRLRADQASMWLLLNPPTAAILAFMLLDEQLRPLQVGGALLVLAAIGAASIGLPTRMASRRSSPPGSGRPTR